MHYFVTLSTNQDSNPGGTVNFAAPATLIGTALVASAIPEIQPLALTNQGGFQPSIVNRAFDRVTALVQQLRREIGLHGFGTQGDPGPTGATGPTGPTGATGATGLPALGLPARRGLLAPRGRQAQPERLAPLA